MIHIWRATQPWAGLGQPGTNLEIVQWILDLPVQYIYIDDVFGINMGFALVKRSISPWFDGFIYGEWQMTNTLFHLGYV
jgi:hypothetical protein